MNKTSVGLAFASASIFGTSLLAISQAEAASAPIQGYICNIRLAVNRLYFTVKSDYGCAGSQLGPVMEVWKDGAGASPSWPADQWTLIVNKLFDNRWSPVYLEFGDYNNRPLHIGFVTN